MQEKNFIGITDPGSKLLKIANDFNFRKVFVNDPNIGGRFSVLSYFGLVPASLIGVDIKKILESATQLCSKTKNLDSDYFENNALRFGAVLGTLARMGKDKLTFMFSKKLYSFGYWAEQLIAESTGKNGVGILPVLNQKNFTSEYLSDDRLFVAMSTSNDSEIENKVLRLKDLGHPIVKIAVDDIHDLVQSFSGLSLLQRLQEVF